MIKKVVVKTASVASSNVTWFGEYEPKKPKSLKKHGKQTVKKIH